MVILFIDALIGIVVVFGLLKVGQRLERKLNANPRASEEEREAIYQQHVNETYHRTNIFGKIIHKPVKQKEKINNFNVYKKL